MQQEAERLFALDEALRLEADQMLVASGIGAILRSRWFEPVGSYAMRTMVWRDLDFELHAEPDLDKFWSLCSAFAATGWCVRLQGIDAYREEWAPFGLYCGLRVAPPPAKAPVSPNIWNLDVWTMREAEAEQRLGPQRRLWQARLNERNRSHILAIKEAASRHPEYGRTLLSIHIYEAVLEQDIRDTEGFFYWWRRKYCAGQVL